MNMGKNLLVILCVVCGAALLSQSFAGDAGEREDELLSVLRSQAPLKAKVDACRELARVATRKSVPVLASLLSDEKLSHMARYALETIRDPSVDAAFRKALKTLHGKLLLGVIGSVGVRRDRGAAGTLVALLRSETLQVAEAAARACGSIGTEEAVEGLVAALKAAPEKLKPALYEGLLRAAEGMVREGEMLRARRLYDRLRSHGEAPHQVRTAAWRGAILSRGKDGVALLTQALQSRDMIVAFAGSRTSLEMPGEAVTKALAAELREARLPLQVLLCEALGERRDRTAVPALLSLAKKGRTQARVAAIGALVQIGDPSVLKALVALRNDEAEPVAKAAAAALTRLTGPGVERALFSLLREADSATKKDVVQLLGQRGSERAVPELLKLAAEGEESLRQASIAALGKLVTAKHFTAVLKLLVAAQSASERRALADILSELCARYSRPEPGAIEIVKAVYGALPKGPSADVTAKVRRMVKRGTVRIGANNGTFGDPAPGVVKKLTVTYKANGRTITDTVNENQTLQLRGGRAPRRFLQALREAYRTAPEEVKKIVARLIQVAGGSS